MIAPPVGRVEGREMVRSAIATIRREERFHKNRNRHRMREIIGFLWTVHRVRTPHEIAGFLRSSEWTALPAERRFLPRLFISGQSAGSISARDATMGVSVGWFDRLAVQSWRARSS